MASRTFASNKSSLFADGSSNLGGGADTHMPVGGPWSGYVFRSAVRFALDFSGMKTISSAVLHMRTSSQVHVGFSSAPDFYVQRCTGDWTANGASGSADGGGGWSTSPTVYPGPASTTSGRVSKRAPTAESTWFDTDITAIVRAWAPGSVAGGGGAPNYGVLLLYVASGDVTEFQSDKSTYAPSIVVTYDVDHAPVATMVGPTGTVGETRPTLTGTASDPDGDPIDNVHVEVYQGSTLVYSGDTGAIVGTFAHVPTTDLPGGALTARCVAGAAGLTSVWSASVSFTIDRPPVVGAFSSPVGATGSRRPPITFATSDPDGDPTTAYDVEVYAMSGGAPVAGAVYLATDQTAGIGAGTVTHTPAADLPGGTLGVRARVRSGPVGAWSDWSGYHAFTVTLTSPSLAWVEPATDGGYLPPFYLIDLSAALATREMWLGVDCQPPAGETLTHLSANVSWAGGPWALFADGAIGPGVWSATLPPTQDRSAPYGSGRLRVTVTSSGGGSTTIERGWKFSALETRAALALGDGVTDLAVALTTKGAVTRVGGAVDTVAEWIRAQSGPDTAAPGANWELPDATGIAIVIGQLPAANAQLGILTRYAQREPGTEVLADGGAEQYPDAYNVTPPGWMITFGTGTLGTSSGSTHSGIRSFNARGPVGAQQTGGLLNAQPVIGGAGYLFTGWRNRESWADANVTIWLGYFDAAEQSLGTSNDAGPYYGRLYWPAGLAPDAWVQRAVGIVTPPTCVHVNLTILSDGGGSDWIDDISLIGPKPGAAGLDVLDVSWKSLG